MQIDPDAELVAALARVPSALAVAGGVRGDIVPDADNSNCMNPAVVNSDAMEAYFIKCFLYPQSMYWDVAQDAVAAADHELDGIVRRSRALVGQQLIDPNTGDALEFFTAAFPVATLIACAGNNGACSTLALNPADITTNVDRGEGFRLPWARTAGQEPPPTPLTTKFRFWLDSGALPALTTHYGGGEAPFNSVASALDVMSFEPDVIAALRASM